MNLSNLTYTKSQYQFQFKGEKGENRVSFAIEGDKLNMECTCGRSRGSEPCWHAQYVLAGKTSRITGGDTSCQKELIEKAEDTKQGKRLLQKARKRFDSEMHCRRCNSEQIVKIKYSPVARLFTLFREVKHHTYFCKKCKWTW